MIHATAIIDSSADLADDVRVGPYSVIGKNVQIDSGTQIGPHVVINGPTKIGQDNKIYQFASVGDDPQDKKYKGEPTLLEIADRNVIREYCTISRGTVQDESITRVGSDNWIMAYVHIAHDCQVGDNIIFSNSASLAGHVVVEDFAILGGFTLVHQFCTVGAHCFTAMNSVINKDVPPYIMVAGHNAKPFGLNIEGLKRRGFSPDKIKQLRNAYKIVYRSSNTLEQAVAALQESSDSVPEVLHMMNFLKRASRGIVR